MLPAMRDENRIFKVARALVHRHMQDGEKGDKSLSLEMVRSMIPYLGTGR